jgi:hypothetical protein
MFKIDMERLLFPKVPLYMESVTRTSEGMFTGGSTSPPLQTNLDFKVFVASTAPLGLQTAMPSSVDIAIIPRSTYNPIAPTPDSGLLSLPAAPRCHAVVSLGISVCFR